MSRLGYLLKAELMMWAEWRVDDLTTRTINNLDNLFINIDLGLYINFN